MNSKSEISIVMDARGGFFRADDAAMELCIACDASPRPDDGIPDDGTGRNHRAGADDGVFDDRPRSNIRKRVQGRAEIKLVVGLQIGFAIAEIEPDAFIEHDGAELIPPGQLQEGRDDGNFFAGRQQVEEAGIRSVL